MASSKAWLKPAALPRTVTDARCQRVQRIASLPAVLVIIGTFASPPKACARRRHLSWHRLISCVRLPSGAPAGVSQYGDWSRAQEAADPPLPLRRRDGQDCHPMYRCDLQVRRRADTRQSFCEAMHCAWNPLHRRCHRCWHPCQGKRDDRPRIQGIVSAKMTA